MKSIEYFPFGPGNYLKCQKLRLHEYRTSRLSVIVNDLVINCITFNLKVNVNVLVDIKLVGYPFSNAEIPQNYNYD